MVFKLLTISTLETIKFYSNKTQRQQKVEEIKKIN